MKRRPLHRAAFGAAMILTLAGASAFASSTLVEPATKEATPVKHDKEALAIIDKAIEAAGGKEMLENATSVHTKGTINIPMAGLSGTMEVYAASGGNLLTKVTIPGFGEQLTGLHDGIGWSIDPMTGPKLLDDDMVADLIVQSDPKASLHTTDLYTSIDYVGETTFEGQEVHQIDYISKSTGKPSTEYYSKETGLLVGSITNTMTEMGELKVTTIVTEYKEYNGFKIASKSTQKMGPMSMSMTTDSASYNDVDMSVFALPDAVKALVEATKEDAENSDG